MIDQKIVHGSYGRGFSRIFWNDNVVVFAFRGTREGIDWLISNLLFLPVPMRHCDAAQGSIKVHFGFQRTLEYVDKTTRLKCMDAIARHIEGHRLFNGRKIVITGHSLGGALAILFANRLRSLYPEYVAEHLDEIVVFGAPAVGLRNFSSWYGELGDKTTRIVNGADVVPFTPPLSYCHVGTEIWLNKHTFRQNLGWMKRLLYSIRLPITNFIRDHDIKKYIDRLSAS